MRFNLTVKNPIKSFLPIWDTLFYIDRWYVAGDIIGRVDGREIQKLEQTIIAFSIIRITVYHKDRYIFYS